MARYLAVVRAKPEYYRMKAHTEKLLKHIPIIGNELSDAAFDIKSALKRIIYSDSWFEDLGLHYIGPIDGHNIQQLCEAFEMAKKYDKPVLLHVNTLKGKGYDLPSVRPSSSTESRSLISTPESLFHPVRAFRAISAISCVVSRPAMTASAP